MGIIDKMRGRGDDSSSMRTAPSFNTAQNIIPNITNATAPLYAAVGGFIVALIALLVPVSILEGFTGATGLSEIIPAARAPLGFTARILFVAFLAILSSAILLLLLMRKGTTAKTEYMSSAEVNEKARERSRMPINGADDAAIAQKLHQQDEERYQKLAAAEEQLAAQNSNDSGTQKAGFAAAAAGGVAAMAALAKSKIAKLPFMGGDDRVRSFDDLPKLRDADSHPDAPPRRPLSANNDLGEQILPSDVRGENVQPLPASDDIPASFSDELAQEALAQEPYLQEASVTDIIDPEPMAPNIVDPDTDASESIMPESADSESGDSETGVHTLNDDSNISADEAVDIADDFDNFSDQSADILESSDDDMITSAAVHTSEDSVNDGDQNDMENSQLPPLDDLIGRLERVVARRTKLRSNVDAMREAHDDAERPVQKIITSQIPDIGQSPDIGQAPDIGSAETVKQPDEALTDPNITPNILGAAKDDQENNLTKDSMKPADGAQKVEMDSALQSALDTLHKMNERSA